MQKIIIWIVYGFGLLLFSCRNGQPAADTESSAAAAPANTDTVQLTAEQLKQAGIATGLVEKRDMHTVLKVNGVVDVPPQNIVSVSMPLGGYLKSMQLLPGMQVSRGQVLAVMEDPQYIQLQQDYLVAKSRLAYLEADFARQQTLNESKANSDKVFQQVKSDYQAQKVMVKALAEKLQLIGIQPEKLNESNISRSVNIHAPISGFVKSVKVNTGKYVSPTEVLFELINPADIHLSLTVFEKDVPNLAAGQKVSCYTNGKEGERYTATIHLITRSINEERASEVHCHFDKYDKRLLPGMFMNAEIALENARVPAVPDDAVVRWENRPYIFIADAAGRFVMTPVETGAVNGGYTEIKTAVEGRQVVTRNAYALLMKMKNSGEEE